MSLGLRIFALIAVVALLGRESAAADSDADFSKFVGLADFSGFTRSRNADGQDILLSPEINSHIPWNELIAAWNAKAPAGTFLRIEASAYLSNRQTQFYTLGNWSPDGKLFPRASVRGQKDSDGEVHTDTLVINQLANAVQIRVTLGGANGATPTLRFLGLSFSNTKVPTASRPPNHAGWGKIIPTPERSQHGYPNEKGWCSPTSLSMTLARWADVLHRPEMNLTVPEVAAAVYDPEFRGTGNWSFNAAFAGSFSGMRSYVTRFDDLSEVEDWIAAGVPVILSARWDLLKPGRPLDTAGHLVVCIGFTETGDVVINDPATRVDKGESVRRVYGREDVIRSWAKSHNTVYLVYPESARIPKDRYGHWQAN